MYCLFCDVLCIACVYMCTELLPPGGYPIAVKYIISYHTIRTSTQWKGSVNCMPWSLYPKEKYSIYPL